MCNGACVYASGSEKQSKRIESFLDLCRVGFGLGLEYHSTEAKLENGFSEFLSELQSDRSQTKKIFQVAPVIEFGMAFGQEVYIGIMMSWRYLSAKTKSRAPLVGMSHFIHEFKIDHYADIFVKPGYKLSPNLMLYGLIGPSIAKWSHNTDQFRQGNKIDNFKINKTTVGLGLGFGMEYLMRKNYAFSIDCAYHMHGTHKQQNSMTFFHAVRVNGIVTHEPFTGTMSKKVDLSYSTVAMRLSYFL